MSNLATDDFGLWVQQLNDEVEEVSKSTGVEYVSYDDIDAFKLDIRTEQAMKHLKAIHSANDGNIAFCYQDFEKYFFDDTFSLSANKIKNMIYRGSLHISQSTFSGYRRLEQTAYSNSVIVIDVDFYNISGLNELPAMNIIELMKMDGLFEYPAPSYWISTGNGISLVFLLEQLPVRAKFFGGNINLRKLVIEKLNRRFMEYGSDFRTSDITRVNKIPGTYNYKTGNMVEILDYEYLDWNNLKRYNLRELAEELGIERITKKKKRNKSGRKVSNLFNMYTLNYYRAQDIKHILTTRVDVEGVREVGLFLYAIHHMNAFEDADRLEEDILLLNLSMAKPLQEKEVYKKILKHVKKGRRYKFKNETIINWLGIQEAEMDDLKTIISKDNRKNRQLKRERADRRNKNCLTSREQAKADNLNIISALLDEGYRQKDIVVETGLSKGTVSKYTKELRTL
ncbi:conserved protein of unknown function [Petrocella atlantisensis]|uniref:Replication protein n=1 Tax=Petrocella atlantisensis TaxID=2173034 RepID=A0A3P7S9W3_9FIRM|nr:hypothetical protein [Petrocella atlantisensis]VDN48679.1 conserved protein of unknown function [Petrocella atlantisensis]